MFSTEHKQHILGDLENTYARIAELDPQVQTDEWEKFKCRMRSYLRRQQEVTHKKKQAHMIDLRNKLRPTLQHSLEEQRDAKAELEAIISSEESDSRFKAEVHAMTDGSRMTRGHFDAAKCQTKEQEKQKQK